MCDLRVRQPCIPWRTFYGCVCACVVLSLSRLPAQAISEGGVSRPVLRWFLGTKRKHSLYCSPLLPLPSPDPFLIKTASRDFSRRSRRVTGKHTNSPHITHIRQGVSHNRDPHASDHQLFPRNVWTGAVKHWLHREKASDGASGLSV